jgi:iron complex transport system ATP-binding protein
MIQLRDVEYRYAKNRPMTVGPINWEIALGEFWLVHGNNGSGKSTLLRLVAGILAPERGLCLIANNAYSQFTPQEMAQKIAWVGGRISEYFRFKVIDMIRMGRYPHQDSNEVPVQEAITRMGLDAHQDRLFNQLSSGEQQRVLIAKSLAQQASIWVLDEPFDHLDLAGRLALIEALRGFVVSGGAVIVAAHEWHLFESDITHTLEMKNGSPTGNRTPAASLKSSCPNH